MKVAKQLYNLLSVSYILNHSINSPVINLYKGNIPVIVNHIKQSVCLLICHAVLLHMNTHTAS